MRQLLFGIFCTNLYGGPSPHRALHIPPVPVALPGLEGLRVRHRVFEVLAGGHGRRARVPVRVDHGENQSVSQKEENDD